MGLFKKRETKEFKNEDIRITVLYTETVNTGSYEARKVSLGISRPLPAGIDANEYLAEVFNSVKAATEDIKEKHGIYSIIGDTNQKTAKRPTNAIEEVEEVL